MTTLLGKEVLVSKILPDFVPVLKMQPCGCSDRALQEMNDWLRRRFGQRREILVIGGHTLAMSEGNYHWLRSAVLSDPLRFGGLT